MKNVKNVGVIGSGLMGTEIAMVFAQHQYKVVLIDNSPVALEQSKKKIDLILKKGIDRGLLTKDDSSNILNNISLEADFNSASNFDLAIEAVFEKISIKENVLKELDQKMPIDSIIASNTSSISITTLSSFLKEERRKLFLGTHFFSPVTRMKLVEVIPCIDTDKECLDSIVSLCTKISKKGIAIKDVVGFAVNRLLHAMIIEAVRLVEEGVASPQDIDTACQLGLGHPIGPFQLLDLTKNSLSVDVQTILENAYGERFKPRPLLKQMVSAGYDGKHVGRGWYNYDKK